MSFVVFVLFCFVFVFLFFCCFLGVFFAVFFFVRELPRRYPCLITFCILRSQQLEQSVELHLQSSSQSLDEWQPRFISWVRQGYRNPKQFFCKVCAEEKKVGMASSPEEEVPVKVLSIQSHVVHGYCGNRSAVFPLQVKYLFTGGNVNLKGSSNWSSTPKNQNIRSVLVGWGYDDDKKRRGPKYQ